jgi:hypothetical protein
VAPQGNGGCSSAGRAPGCGPGCRGFEPRHSPVVEGCSAASAAFPFAGSVSSGGPAPRPPAGEASPPGPPLLGALAGIALLTGLLGWSGLGLWLIPRYRSRPSSARSGCVSLLLLVLRLALLRPSLAFLASLIASPSLHLVSLFAGPHVASPSPAPPTRCFRLSLSSARAPYPSLSRLTSARAAYRPHSYSPSVSGLPSLFATNSSPPLFASLIVTSPPFSRSTSLAATNSSPLSSPPSWSPLPPSPGLSHSPPLTLHLAPIRPRVRTSPTLRLPHSSPPSLFAFLSSPSSLRLPLCAFLSSPPASSPLPLRFSPPLCVAHAPSAHLSSLRIPFLLACSLALTSARTLRLASSSSRPALVARPLTSALSPYLSSLHLPALVTSLTLPLPQPPLSPLPRSHLCLTLTLPLALTFASPSPLPLRRRTLTSATPPRFATAGHTSSILTSAGSGLALLLPPSGLGRSKENGGPRAAVV